MLFSFTSSFTVVLYFIAKHDRVSPFFIVIVFVLCGSSGSVGFSGSSGFSGFSGFVGSTGFVGSSGFVGSTGFVGSSGVGILDVSDKNISFVYLSLST